MALKYKIPPGNPTVVWDDDANGITNDPYVSWQMHLNRTNGQRGGVDMTASNGTPLYAPMDCTVTHYSGGAGNAVRMFAADGSGWSDVFDHMSSIAVPNNTVVPFGGLVGYSGDTGSPGAYHLHWHRLDPSGIRRIPWDYFTDGTTTPLPNGDEMPTLSQSTRTQAVALESRTWAQIDQPATQWPTLPYADGSAATNLAELQPAKSLFDATIYLYGRNLPAGEFVHVRLGLQSKVNNSVSGVASAIFTGATGGRFRFQYNGRVAIDQANTRLIVQAFASVPGVTLDLWRADVAAW